jgi:hypothetical protein
LLEKIHEKKNLWWCADVGVEAWCLEYPAPDPNVCHGSDGLRYCRNDCVAIGNGFVGGECNKGTCYCLKCADEPLPAPRAL